MRWLFLLAVLAGLGACHHRPLPPPTPCDAYLLEDGGFLLDCNPRPADAGESKPIGAL
jgi:hypothetical protein